MKNDAKIYVPCHMSYNLKTVYAQLWKTRRFTNSCSIYGIFCQQKPFQRKCDLRQIAVVMFGDGGVTHRRRQFRRGAADGTGAQICFARRIGSF